MSTGILIIIGIVLVAAVGGFVLHSLFHRFGRSRQRAMERHPAPPGRVGRTSEFRQDR
jgi:predicted RND superfamily exporter protein